MTAHPSWVVVLVKSAEGWCLMAGLYRFALAHSKYIKAWTFRRTSNNRQLYANMVA